MPCTWQVATDETFETVIASGEAVARAERDFTVKVDATGLAPAQSYCYRFIANGVVFTRWLHSHAARGAGE